MSGNLENLTNEELRQKLQACGFANVPVTTTTRKILERKLLAHMAGGDAQPNKTRRETIQVPAQVSSESEDSDRGHKAATAKERKESKSTLRRATVAATSTGAFAPPAAVSTPQSKNTRRSGRITPTPQLQPDVIVSTAPSVPAIQEDTTDDDDVIFIDDTSPRRSHSKSPSLSRSDIVTTSYKQVREKVADLDDFDEQELEYEAEEVEVENTYDKRTVDPLDSLHSLRKSIQRSERMTPPIESGYFGDTNPVRLSYTGPSVSSIRPRNTLSSYSDTMRSTYTSSKPGNLTDMPSYSQPMRYVETQESDEADAPMEEDPILSKAKHLSNVTRKWEQMVNEPLDIGGRRRTNFSQTGSAGLARSPIHEDQHNSSQLAGLERQYRWYIISAVVALALIFVYVMFLTP